MGKQRNRRQRLVIGGEAFNENVKEEKVRFRDGEEECTSVESGIEVEEFVGEFGGDGNVV